MPLVVKDRVRETTTTVGTGTVTLDGAVAGFQSFAAIGDANTTYYTINLPGANEWEVGIGTYSASGTTLTRDTVLASSDNGNLVNFSAGTKDVFCTYPAGRSVYYDTSNNVSINNTLDVTNLEVTNIKAKDGTPVAVLTDSTGALNVSNAVTFSATTQNIDLGTSQTTGSFALGGLSQTGSISIGQSTKTYNFNIAAGVTENGQTKFVNIGTGGVSGSSTNIQIGSSNGTNVTVSGLVTLYDSVLMSTSTGTLNFGTSQTSGTFTVGGAAQTGAITVDQSTKTHTLALGSGATESGQVKTITIGTGGVSGSTTTMTIGSANGTTVTANGSWSYASNPTFSGGTANGVVYLNASKVATSGSVLTFDGTNLSLIEANGSGAKTLLMQGGATAGDYGIISVANGSTVRGRLVADASVDGFRIDTAGGASTAIQFLVGSSFTEKVRLTAAGTLNIVGAGTAGSTQAISFNGSTPVNTLVTTSGGLVGIGTNAPGVKLDVTGSGRFGAGTGIPTLTVNGGSGSDTGPYIQLQKAGANTFYLGYMSSVVGGSSNDSVLYNGASNGFRIYTNNALSAYFDSSGNLGLGVTPSAWGGDTALELRQAASLFGFSATTNLLQNAYYNGSNWIYKNTAGAMLYQVGRDAHRWFTSPSGTAGNAISFTQAMTLDASGNLGLGVAPSAWGGTTKAIEVVNGPSIMAFSTNAYYGANYYYNGSNYIYKNNGRAYNYVQDANGHAWFIAPSGTAGNAISFTQAMTLDASGRLSLFSTASSYSMQIGDGAASSRDVAIIGGSSNAATQRYDLSGTGTLTVGFNNSGSAVNNLPSGVAGMWMHQAYPLVFATSATERVRITSAGDVGIGTSTFATGSRLAVQTTSGKLDVRAYGGASVKLSSSAAMGYNAATGNGHIWEVNDAEVARITSGGSIFKTSGTNATIPAIAASPVEGEIRGTVDNVITNDSGLLRLTAGGGTTVGVQAGIDIFRGGTDGSLVRMWTNGTERARITSGGYFKASNAGTYANSTGTYHELRQTANAQAVVVSATNASYTSESISSLVTKTAGTDWLHFYGTSDANTVANIKIFGNGNIQNANGSYGTISDQKLKQDITDASSQWNDIKAIRFRKYRMKTDVAANPDAPYLIGVVAQELEQTSPNLVEETEDKIDGGTVKSVKTSVLLMKAAVALQEAMARIETLEAEVAALKGA